MSVQRRVLALAFLNVLVLPAMSASSSSSTAEPANPTAPTYTDDMTWLTGYLTIHSLSINSYVYMFLFWFLVLAVFIALSWATWTDVRATALGARWSKWALRRRTWRKKHTLKKTAEEARKLGVPVAAVHRQPRSLPSNAQILTATLLVLVVLVVCFVGPDYINPDSSLFDFSGSSSSSSSSSKTKRAKLTAPINDETMAPYIAHYNIQKAWWTSAARTGGVAFALFPLVIVLALKSPPFAVFGIPGLVAYGHDKMIRLHRYVGRLIWFVTLLHTLFWVVQVLKDRRESTGKLVFMYVWGYQKFRFAWVAFLSMTILMITSLDCIRTPHYEIFYITHVVFTPMTIIFSALHHPQRGVWAWCAAALALWVGERVWRAFWWVWVNGVFGVGGRAKGRVGTGPGVVSPYVYHPRPAEKDSALEAPRYSTPSRGSTTTLTNGNPVTSLKGASFEDARSGNEQWEMNPLRAPAPRRPGFPIGVNDGEGAGFDKNMHSRRSSSLSAETAYGNNGNNVHTHEDGPTPTPGELMGLARVQNGNNTNAPGGGRTMPLQIQTQPTYPPATHARYAAAIQSPGAGPSARSASSVQHHFQPQPMRSRAYAPPPGYALATLLPGRTIRLRLVTPGYQTWAPGQHFLVGIPAVSRFTTHPFSVASVCDEQAAMFVDPDAAAAEGGGKRLVQAEAGRELVLLVRAKKGWTKRLWDLVSSLQTQGLTSPPDESLPSGCTPPPQGTPGVVLRTLVDGPFGTAGKTRWGRYSSVLIISGGSGVAFGLSVLEYVCLCIAGRDGRFLGGYPGGWGVGPKGAARAWVTQRVRFVWLVREYAHIQWCATALRRCLAIVPTDALELNIFVTNCRAPREMGMGAGAPGAGVSPGGLMSAEGDERDDAGFLKPPAPRFFGAGAGGRGRSGSSSVPASPLSSEESLVYGYATDASVDSIVDSYFEGHDEHGQRMEGSELGHETHLLDYTNFDGDDDTPMPGEHRLSSRIIKEGKMRRARSKKVRSVVLARRELEERAKAERAAVEREERAKADPYYAYEHHARPPADEVYNAPSRLSTHSTVPLLPYSSSSTPAPLGAPNPPNPAEAPTISPLSTFSSFSVFERHGQQQSPHPHPQSQSQMQPQMQPQPYNAPPSSFAAFVAGANVNEAPPNPKRFSGSSSSTLKSPFDSTPSLTPSTLVPGSSSTSAGGGVRWAESPGPASPGDLKSWSGLSNAGALGSGLALDPQEVRDLQIVSEWARAGKPKLGRILADEVGRAKGRIAVACCGPTSLNALMRKHITEQIDPARVARGDMSGSIDFIAEDFEY